MTLSEAKAIIMGFEADPDCLSDEDFFLYTEAMGVAIQKTQSPLYMMELGGAYYSRREYDLALKYYEMAAALGYESAILGLGYIWYYGRTGTVDYEKAFGYFSALPDDLNARYKVADMYKNGYFVAKDYEKYKQIIEQLYKEARRLSNPNSPLPEIAVRLAGIRAAQGREEEAILLYLRAKKLLALRLEENPFYGNLRIMKRLIRELYAIRKQYPGKLDLSAIDLYDLFELFREPCRVTFLYIGEEHYAEATREDGRMVIEFDGRWYRGVDDFFEKAEIDGERLTSLAPALQNITATL